MNGSAGGSAGAFLIWGGGGHGMVVADLVRTCGHALVGFVDADPDKLGVRVEPGGGKVVAGQAGFLAAVAAGADLPEGASSVALAIGDNRTREGCLGRLAGVPVPVLVHATAAVSPSARLARGTVVLPQAVVNAAAVVGEAVIVNSGAVVEHDCVLHGAVHVSPGAVLGGGVTVGKRSWIGAGATVIPGIRIGDDVVVGAGAVVIRDVDSGTTVVGNPARKLHRGK